MNSAELLSQVLDQSTQRAPERQAMWGAGLGWTTVGEYRLADADHERIAGWLDETEREAEKAA